MCICPQYETDALLRVVNVDRYDDRRIVRTNLLESYDELLEFSRKHLPAPFFLEEDKRLNLREIIVRKPTRCAPSEVCEKLPSLLDSR